MITKKEVIKLSKIYQPFCISIFIPTHRAGEETLNGKDALKLKNQLKEVKQKLSEKEMNNNEIEEYLKPVNDLLENKEFWRHQSDGLAIFISEGIFKKYTIPVYFEEFNYVSNEFYIKPLMPFFSENGLFYLLSLTANVVKFYEGSKYEIIEIDIKDIVPQKLEDEVGYDYEQKSLQFRTQQGNKGAGSFHGHGEGSAKSDNELQKYFRAIDKGIMSIIHDNQKPPLVICSLDSYFSQYQEINSYTNLFPENISTNPDDIDIFLMHEKAIELLQPYLKKTQKKKLEEFQHALSNGKASSDINKIIPVGLQGKVDTLFLQNRADIFGVFNPETQEVKLQPNNQIANTSLMNLLAAKTFEQGGTIYLMEKNEMPDSTSKVNALYRY